MPILPDDVTARLSREEALDDMIARFLLHFESCAKCGDCDDLDVLAAEACELIGVDPEPKIPKRRRKR